jgi:hypothetical protein
VWRVAVSRNSNKPCSAYDDLSLNVKEFGVEDFGIFVTFDSSIHIYMDVDTNIPESVNTFI